VSDIFLGWQHVNSGLDGQERDFYIRQLKDWKGSFAFEAALPAGAAAYGRACGWTLARAHARSGDRVAIASYLGKSDAFDRATAEFARAYADLNDRDYAALVEAARSGRITVEEGR
jgi:predicted alpha/beta hydrolase